MKSGFAIGIPTQEFSGEKKSGLLYAGISLVTDRSWWCIALWVWISKLWFVAVIS
jgi:hypothetical protein